MKTVEELKQMKYDMTRKMGDYLEGLTEWITYIEEHEREDSELYQKGLNDAWEMARKIVVSPSEGDGMNIDDLVQCFGEFSYSKLLRLPVSEVKEKYDAWKAKKEQDAEVVRHDRWIRDEFGVRCGACGLYAYRDKFDQPWKSPYCPHCGAKMDIE